MILPPILVNHGIQLKEALEDYLGVACVKKVTIEEQHTQVTFLPVPATDKLKQFICDLSDEVFFVYKGQTYTLRSEYLDV